MHLKAWIAFFVQFLLTGLTTAFAQTEPLRGDILHTSMGDIYIVDIETQQSTRLTTGIEAVLPTRSPDGTKIAYLEGTGDGYALKVITADGMPVATIETQNMSLDPLSWSPDNQYLAYTIFVGQDSEVEVFIARADGTEKTNISQNMAYDTSAAWSPDGTTIAFVSDRSGTQNIHLYDVAQQTTTQITFDAEPKSSISWASDGTRLVFVHHPDDTCPLIDVIDRSGSNRQTISAEICEVGNLRWLPGREELLYLENAAIFRLPFNGTASMVMILPYRNPEDFQTSFDVRLEPVPLPDRMSSAAWSPDGQWVAAGSWNGSIYFYDGAAGQFTRTLTGHDDWISDVAWSSDSTRLASVSGDSTLQVWSIPSGELLRTVTMAADYATAVIWSLDGSQLLTGTIEDNPNIRIWDSDTGTFIQGIDTGSVSRMFWSPTSDHLAIANPTGSVDIINYIDLTWIKSLVSPEPTGLGYDVFTLSWNPDATRIAAGSLNGTVRIWDVASGQIVTDLRANEAPTIDSTKSLVTALRYSEDGSQLSSISADGTFRTWDALTGEFLQTVQLPGAAYAAAFSPDGSNLAYGTNGGDFVIIPVPAHPSPG